MIEFAAFASGSKGNYYECREGESRLAIEAGIPIGQLKVCAKHMVSSLEGCLISHAHGDHSCSVKHLVKAGVTCYMSKECADAIGIQSHFIRILEPEVSVQIGKFRVMPFSVRHDRHQTGTIGFVVDSLEGGRLVYLTDCVYCQYYGIEGVTIWAIEANYDIDILKRNIAGGHLNDVAGTRVIDSHMEIGQTIATLQANDLSKTEEIWLLHLSDGNSNEKDFIRRVQAATGRPTYVAGS